MGDFFAVHARTLQASPRSRSQRRGSSKALGVSRLVGVQEPSQPSRLVGRGKRVGLVWSQRNSGSTASELLVQAVKETI
jgi:hypothetical protein